MRPTEVVLSLAATGSSGLVMGNNLLVSPNASVGVTYDSGGSGTYSVSYSIDDPNDWNAVLAVAAASATLTLTDNRPTGHGLRVGDEVLLMASGSSVIDGNSVVASVTSATVFTITLASAVTINTQIQACYMKMWQLTAQKTQTVATIGNYPFPVTCFRLDCTLLGAGNARMRVTMGMGR